MSVHAPDPPHTDRSPDQGHAGPPLPPTPRRRSHFGYLWLRALILLLGMLLGAALLATFQATGNLPPPPVGDGTAELESDVVLSIREAYLNRVIAERASDPAAASPIQNLQVELHPNRRLAFVGDVQVFNQRLKANANGIVGVADGRIQVQVDEVQVGTLRLPAELGNLVAQPINVELERLAPDDQFRIVDVATATDRIVIRLAATGSQSGQRPR